MIQVGFFGAGGSLGVSGVTQITSEVADAIRASGFDATQFDSMIWPIGAANHGSGRYLIHQSNIPTAVRSGDSSRFRIGDQLIFDRLFLVNPSPIMLGRRGYEGVFYACDIVDERYFWRSKAVIEGRFNISLDDKSKLYDSSERLTGDPEIDDTPYTPKLAVEKLLTERGIDIGLFSWPTGSSLDDADYLRDIDVTHWPIGKAIDCILSAAGAVLIAFPSTFYPGGISGKRYEIQEIGTGEARMVTELGRFGDLLMGGGIIGTSDAVAAPSGYADIAVGPGSDLDQIVPASINVIFPTAPEGGIGFIHNDEDESSENRNYVTDRWHSISSSSGIPEGISGTGSVAIFDSTWAIVTQGGEIDNSAALTTRAAAVAGHYYDRFESGSGELLFLNIQSLKQWSGAQEIIWSVSDAGAYTRTRGRYDHPLFGYRPAGAHDLQTTGAIRAIPRPDGKILLDVPFQVATGAYPAIIRTEGAQWDAINQRDEFGFDEIQLNENRRWEPGGAGRTSTADGVLIAVPAFAFGEFLPESFSNGQPVIMRDHETIDGDRLRLFQYPSFFPVVIWPNGGDIGTDTGPPSWKYTLFDFAGNVLDDSLQIPREPIFRPIPFGNMIAAPQGSVGLAFYQDGELILYSAPEQLDLGVCP